MKVLLMRHGQSANNPLEAAADYAQRRQPDPPLTALGQRQAEKAATALATAGWVGAPVTRLFSSLTLRAAQTAAPLAAALDLPVEGAALAYECGGLTTGPAGGFAAVPGREYASLRAECPALLWPAELQGQRWDGGAEAWAAAAFASRAAQVAELLRRSAAEGSGLTVLVTHHDFAQFLLADLLGLPQPDVTEPIFRLHNASLTLLELWPSGATLSYADRVDYLPLAERTY
ncbi:histidine phosphatase family protein [Deinococcus sp. Marseille-Q6407]|uniref:histidine phosphatase family protein n=1 Tax=Deinococcus sp. Marseille-Q6407 TaxID=2969223 RepID=UPI0021BF9597|nr:histidine phosphatase family protein [Deinococcus sp. Marseille-Q6407]